MKRLKETELYGPVKELLQQMGYDVKGEVAHVDLVATKGDEFVLVELKTSFTLKLLLQATQRQKMSRFVYIALPAPTPRQRFSKAFKEYEHLLKRLELGLILVNFKKNPPEAQLIFQPLPYDRQKVLNRHSKQRKFLLKEAEERFGDYNVGGGKGKVITVYRQDALLLASHMSQDQPMKAYILKDLTSIERAAAILHANHYGWFKKVERGTYVLSPKYFEDKQDFALVLADMMAEEQNEGSNGEAENTDLKPLS